ncbi:hypothetical protein [Sebaldella sp. S0638]|uniref:hypothetical protein n=1 Tax=Sebaldella sp. S0638 TaxID=2957809 RepID=UPI0020A1FCCB|nr:hypothetical protein [Sebaldella sp. S0638]MCP1223811.1 hypothetical protein [Sebaldella sp. S0638]
MGTDEGYRLRLARFGVKYKNNTESKKYKAIKFGVLFLYFSILYVYLIFWKLFEL